jgi:hypothetical protein
MENNLECTCKILTARKIDESRESFERWNSRPRVRFWACHDEMVIIEVLLEIQWLEVQASGLSCVESHGEVSTWIFSTSICWRIGNDPKRKTLLSRISISNLMTAARGSESHHVLDWEP